LTKRNSTGFTLLGRSAARAPEEEKNLGFAGESGKMEID
jgi:hypothetical protein